MLLGGLSIVALGSALEILEFGIIFGGFFLVIGLLMLIVAYFLWKGSTLGWYLVIVLLALDIVFGIYSIVTGDFSGVFGLFVAAFLAWYFLRPNVRAFFGT